MRVILGCERFGAVRRAFNKKGHAAFSCDIEDSEDSGPHLKGKLQDYINKKWDILIAFPPCTYLCSSGLHWNKRVKGRQEKTEEALNFICFILNSRIKKIALENPIGCISTRIAFYKGRYIVIPLELKGLIKAIKPAQTIQPYQFGNDASKATCLYLKGLKPLKQTKYIAPRIVNGKKRWGNQLDSGQNKLGPSEDRAALRGKTYSGIAKAMADQWG